MSTVVSDMLASASEFSSGNDSADEISLNALLDCDPVWVSVMPAKEAFNFPARTILHAGPPLSASGPCTPVENSAVMAILYEGWTNDECSARSMIMAGDVKFRPAQDFKAVVPLASVISPSMMVQVVEDNRNPENRAYSPIDGGSARALRLGRCHSEVLSHLKWLNGEFAEAIAKTARGRVPLLNLANWGLLDGDDCHARTAAATAILARQIVSRIAGSAAFRAVDSFLNDGPSFFLNLWMAAARCMLNAGSGVHGSSMISALGANGKETGIQISGLPGQWFTAEAVAPKGALLDGFKQDDCLGAVGDCAIVDALGLGAMSLAHVREQLKALQLFMPADWRNLSETLMPAVHPAFSAFGVHVGLTASRVAGLSRTPAISLGMIHNRGASGCIGAGIYSPPVAPFRDAMTHLKSSLSSGRI